MAALTPIVHPRSRFHVTPAAGMLTAEASDLESVNSRVARRLYDDACDVGFAIPDQSGAPVLFSLAREQRDGEGDLMYEDYVAVDPDRGGLVVRVYND